MISTIKTIVARELSADLRSKSFWIGTFALPVVSIVFGLIVGFIAEDSSGLKMLAETTSPDMSEDISGAQLMGMMMGMFLTMFIMIYGAQIFQKVKYEKTNRIVEIMAACVPGRTMMAAKVIAVGLLGAFQMLLWGLLIMIFGSLVIILFAIDVPWHYLLDPRVLMAVVWGVVYFIGGYAFYGALFACVGAMADRDNENQEYMTILTFVLLASFYLSAYSADHTGAASFWLSVIPFTSPGVGATMAVSGAAPWWATLLSVGVLYGCAALAIILAGKIYTTAIMLKGKRFTPRDIITFLRAR